MQLSSSAQRDTGVETWYIRFELT